MPQSGAFEMPPQRLDKARPRFGPYSSRPAVHPKPGVDERSEQPRPHRALVVDRIACGCIAFVSGCVSRLVWRQGSQSKWCEESILHRRDDAFRPPSLDECERQAANGENLIRPERVFDFLAYGVDRGTVTLAGYAYREHLKRDAYRAVKRLAGVDDVADTIQLLPTSQEDDRIRWATFYNIYTDDFLSRYSPGGAMGARYQALSFTRFPGMQPFGMYPIHIIVNNGRITLVGVVDNESDRTLAGVRAREVPRTFGVENELIVRTRK